jgi:hypothetical protein
MRHRFTAAAATLLVFAAAAYADLRPTQILGGGGALGNTSAYSLRGVVTGYGAPFGVTVSSNASHMIRDSFYPAVVAYSPNKNAADADWLTLTDSTDFDAPRSLPEKLHACNLNSKEWIP